MLRTQAAVPQASSSSVPQPGPSVSKPSYYRPIKMVHMSSQYGNGAPVTNGGSSTSVFSSKPSVKHRVVTAPAAPHTTVLATTAPGHDISMMATPSGSSSVPHPHGRPLLPPGAVAGPSSNGIGLPSNSLKRSLSPSREAPVKRLKESTAQPCSICNHGPYHQVKDCTVVRQGSARCAWTVIHLLDFTEMGHRRMQLEIARLEGDPAQHANVQILRKFLGRQQAREQLAASGSSSKAPVAPIVIND